MKGRRQHVMRQKLSGFYQQAKFITVGSHQRSKAVFPLILSSLTTVF